MTTDAATINRVVDTWIDERARKKLLLPILSYLFFPLSQFARQFSLLLAHEQLQTYLNDTFLVLAHMQNTTYICPMKKQIYSTLPLSGRQFCRLRPITDISDVPGGSDE